MILSVIPVLGQETFNAEDVSTWIEDADSLRGLSVEDKKVGWDGEGLEVKENVVNSIANSFRPNSEIKLIGFENGLEWGDGLVIGNGNAWVDLEKIHVVISEIEYIEGDDEKYFVFRLKDDREIKIEKGSLDENGNYINMDLMAGVGEGDRSVKFNLGDGELRVSEDGEVIFSGGAKVIIGGREFVSNLEGEASLEIVESDYFRVKGVVVKTDDAIVKIKGITDLIFKEGDYSSLGDYVQIYEGELKSSRADPLNPLASTTQGRILNIKGKDVEVEILSDIHEGVIDGENIVVKNGEIVQRFDGAKTFVNRKGFEAFLVSDLVNVQAEGEGEIKTEVGVEEGETKTIVSEKQVCIGKFCTIGGLGFTGFYSKEHPLGTKPSFREELVSETYIYASESKVQEFLNLVKKEGLNENEVKTQAPIFFDNIEAITTIKKTDLTWEAIQPGLKETIASLKLPSTEEVKVVEFRRKVFKYLGGDKTGDDTIIPGETKIVTTTSGKEYGIISFKFPEGKIWNHKIKGNYFEVLTKKNLKGKPYRLSELLKEI